jgi:hypothetical protein
MLLIKRDVTVILTYTDLMFKEARLKVERANEHIRDFDSRCAEFFKSGAGVITIKPDSETGDDFVEITAQAMPDSFALIIGDALHNLKSALDFVWWEIVSGDTQKGTKENFPIYRTDKELIAFLDQRKQQQSVVTIADTLLNVIQPYFTGDGESLFHLHKLNIMDKHKLLIPQIQALKLYTFFVEDEHGERHGINERLFSAKRPLILKHRGSGKLKVIKEGYCHAAVIFGKRTPVAGRIVAPTLRSFAVAVNRVLTILG